MAVDFFLKLDGIPGESKDKAHKGEIDVLAWSWGMSQSGTMHMGGGGGGGKASFQDLSFTTYYEKSTPKLMEMCATGGHIPKGSLFCRKAGGKQEEVIIYDITDVLVTSVSTGGSGGEDRQTVNFSLNFAKIETKYKEQKQDGGLEPPVNFGYNIQENEKL
jgi:type VI secretion system secreted protein Hcp